MRYDRTTHAARSTESYVFHQLIPYIGNKRKLLPLIGRALEAAGAHPETTAFVDLFAGSGVVSRYAKQLGYGVHSNDWEPYAQAINRCYIGLNRAPSFRAFGGYEAAIAHYNALPPKEGWITHHLCPKSDTEYDVATERMFYMRKNGMRIDAIREALQEDRASGKIDADAFHAILAPLLYQACYTSNTSGVFKGFHNGWGGQTGTALYRIAGDLTLAPALFQDNGRPQRVTRMDAALFVKDEMPKIKGERFVYLDPPYNQHPYGSNYHVLNTVTLWDAPLLAPTITGRGDKSAIRHDWRTERRSAYNAARDAANAYAETLQRMDARFIATSYSTDGNIPLLSMIESNLSRGHVEVFLQTYKRYRVSSQRFSKKPMNVEFVLLTDTTRKPAESAAAIRDRILDAEREALAVRPEIALAAAV